MLPTDIINITKKFTEILSTKNDCAIHGLKAHNLNKAITCKDQ